MEDAYAAALVCFNAARQASQAAAQLRVQQLMTEGHGPQRHEGMPSEKTLKERAVYRIDPETHTQCDAEEGIHCADLASSKFVSNEIYVKAEALGRAAARERLRLDPLADPTSRVPLHQIGANVVIGYRCAVRPPAVETSLGRTVQIPTRGGYVYGPNVPPPNRGQMDAGAMQQALNATTRIGYAPNDEALVVLRKDINGNLYLRTMFPQHAVQ